MTAEDKVDILVDGLNELLRLKEKAWMPVRCFRSEVQAELDDVRYEVWDKVADIAKELLKEVDEYAEH
jgi:hypothetical protein